MESRPHSPCSFNLKSLQAFRLALRPASLLDAVDPRTSRSSRQGSTQLADLLFTARRQHFHIAACRVAHPAAQPNFVSFSLHKPAKAHSLHTTLHNVVAHHDSKGSVADEKRNAQPEKDESPSTLCSRSNDAWDERLDVMSIARVLLAEGLQHELFLNANLQQKCTCDHGHYQKIQDRSQGHRRA
jgi:hypothetical protein